MNPVEQQLALALIEVGAIKFGEFRLKLHEKNPDAPLSPIYLNLRTPDNPKSGPLTPQIVDTAAQCMSRIARDLEHHFDLVAGVPRAGDPFAARLAVYSEVSLLKLDKHEDVDKRNISRIIEGAWMPGGSVLLVDDLITQADSKLEAIRVLEKNGLRVRDAVVLVDREQGGVTGLARFGCTLHTIFTLTELLDFYVAESRIPPEKRDKVLEYVKNNS
ncbi:MAG: phosphoribosyltransferase family protein [Patescibacteria group bacterium]|nr:phosphoribosyltransferase family protein [Patescibacteria group bacterium]